MRAAAIERLGAYAAGSADPLDEMLYVHTGVGVAEHLFAVAGGLDSLVPGEAQILSQIRGAHADRVGRWLDRGGYQPPVRRGDRGRQTDPQRDLDRRRRCVGGVGRRRGRAPAPGRPRRRHGAGDRRGQDRPADRGKPRSRGVGDFIFANRTGEAAAGLAARFGGESVALDESALRSAGPTSWSARPSAPGYVVAAECVPAGAAGVHRSGPAARHRPRHRRRGRRQRDQHRRARGGGAPQHRAARGRVRRRRGRSWSSRRRSSAAGWRRSRWCPRSRRCARWPSRSAWPSWSGPRAAGRG